MSLYEDLVAAWVPAKHEWLRPRPLGQELVAKLGKQKMFSYCACRFSGEVTKILIDALVYDIFACLHNVFDRTFKCILFVHFLCLICLFL